MVPELDSSPTMCAPPVRYRAARVGGALALTIGAGLLLATPVLAATGITVTSGGCSGGGSVFCFAPEGAKAVTGTAATWTNQSGVAHTVTVCTPSACPAAPPNTGPNTFNLSLGAGNGSGATFTFTAAGRYTYYCTIHGYALMHGTITVTSATTTPTPGPTPTPSRRGHVPAPLTGAGITITFLLLPLAGLILAASGVALRRLR